MSTRAVYGFKDDYSTFWVYVHHDGYPEGAAEKFKDTLDSKRIWPLPRYEADEFAAGFIAANKTESGSVRLTIGPGSHSDTEFCYVVSMESYGLRIVAFDSGDTIGKVFFDGPLDKFIEKYKSS